jgi:type II secretion system protein H
MILRMTQTLQPPLPAPDRQRADGVGLIRRRTTRGFTLVELILVLALLVIATSLAAPALSNFVRGRALDSEARRMLALMHAGQSRAVSEGLPMMLWVDSQAGRYGLEAETSGQNGDGKTENLDVDSTLRMTAVNGGAGTPVTFKNLPAIKFLADGSIDENSLPELKLLDSAGFARWFRLNTTRTGYEVRDTEN